MQRTYLTGEAAQCLFDLSDAINHNDISQAQKCLDAFYNQLDVENDAYLAEIRAETEALRAGLTK